ncbi:MAG TPA: hypothetical protein VFA13_12785 [Candidatus Acidoferrum sp.]|nr:hypothetical protein [Candidatus Acidoferrum sp.]
MARNPTQPPWEFLLSASRNSLQSYEFTRLAHAANLRKEISALLNQWLEENAAAMLARWLMDQRERNPETARQSGLAPEPAPDVQPDVRRGGACHRPPAGRVFATAAAFAPDRARLNPQPASDNFFADLPDFVAGRRGSA